VPTLLAMRFDDDIRRMSHDTAALWRDPRPAAYAEAAAQDRAGDSAGAASAYRRLSGIWPAHRTTIRYNLASALLRQGRVARAVVCFSTLADDPAVPLPLRAGAHFHLGRLAEARGAVSAARDHYRSALVLLPDHRDARARLASLERTPRDASAAPLPRPRPSPRVGTRRAEHGPVLVYQMGKVGSTSLTAALRASAPAVEIHTCHALDEATLVRSEAWLASDAVVPAALAAAISAERIEARALRARLLGAGPRWRILTMTREPIAHLVSVLFHHLELYSTLSGADRVHGDARLACLHRFAVDAWTRWAAGGQSALDPARASLFLSATWFEREFQSVLGIDVRTTPMTSRRGYTRLRAARAEIVLVRFEDLPWAAPDAMAALCGVRDVSLPTENRGLDKASGPLYLEFLARCRFSSNLVDAIYATPYARHFYTDAEREVLARRWRVDSD
jgi:tetratricopeptide (TPR) repeat protein